jgi:fucose permease
MASPEIHDVYACRVASTLRGMRSPHFSARAACWTGFLVTGTVSATWAARIPAVQERLDLTPGGLAVAVLGIEGGALLGLPLGAAVVSRLGTRASLPLAFLVYAPGLLFPAVAPSLVWLTVGLAVWATANSVLDVALNAEGVVLERHYERPLLSSLHAAQSLGLLSGALSATIAAAAHVGLLLHFGMIAGLGTVVGVLAAVPLSSSRSARPVAVRPSRSLLQLGAVAFCAFLIDGVASNWIAVHLTSAHGATKGVAAASYLVFTAALVLGRLRGDWLTRTCSPQAVIRLCGLGTVLGGATVVLAPSGSVAFAGWAAVGLALAPLAPTVLGAAPRVGRNSGPVAIAGVTSLGYLGSFSGPPAVGALAQLSDLSTALVLLPVIGATAVLRARGAVEPSRTSLRRSRRV